MRRSIISIVILFVLNISSVGQEQSKLDSLNFILSTSSNHKEIIDASYYLAKEYSNRHPEKALNSLQRSLSVARNINSIPMVIRGLKLEATLYLELEKFDEAIDAANEVYIISQKNNFTQEMLLSNILQARIWFEQGEPDKAKNYLESLDIETKSFRQVEAERLFVLGNIYYAQGSLIVSIELLNRAIKLVEGNDSDRIGLYHFRLAQMYIETEDVSEASKQIEKAIRELKHHKDVYYLAKANLLYANIFYKQGSVEEALKYFNRAADLAAKINYTEVLSDSYRKLSEVYSLLGDSEHAYTFLRSYMSLNDDKMALDNELKTVIEDAKQKRKELAEKQQEIEASKERTRFIVLMSLVIIIVLLAGLALMLYLGYRRNQRQNYNLMVAKERAVASEREKERFLAYASHEIRTPLNAVYGSLRLLEKQGVPESQEEHVETIKSSTKHVLRMVNDILDLSKMEEGKYEFQNNDFFIDDIVHEVYNVLHLKAEEKGIYLKTIIDKEVPKIVKGDPVRLSQVLINIADNGIKFTSKGGVSIRVSVIKRDEKEWLKFTIEDTGKGIRKSSLETIFQQYEQESRHTSKQHGGTGLGLAISKQIVELQGGQLNVDSEFGKGTSFTFDIPLKRSKKMQNIQDKSQVLLEYDFNDLQILLVDDNDLNRKIMIDLLKSESVNIEVNEAKDGEEALRLLSEPKNKLPDVVLMDIQMPKISGIEVLKELKNRRSIESLPPIIGMSAYDDLEIRNEALDAGMKDYMVKPIDPVVLLNKLAVYVTSGKIKIGKEIANKQSERLDKITNLERLNELSKGNVSRIKRYIDIFLANLPNELVNLRQNRIDGDFQEMSAVAHKLKGTVAYMGLQSFEKELKKIDQKSKIGRLSPQQLDEILNKINDLAGEASIELQSARDIL